MRHHRELQLAYLLLPIVGLGIPAMATIALADSVPESIRIQEKAEKAYEVAPVVPIERGNAHHRELLNDDQGGGGEFLPPPQPHLPPQPAKVRDDTSH